MFLKNFISILFIIVSVFFVFPQKSIAGRCTGSANCHACTTCSSCKHCNRDDGTCGVCGEGDNRSYSSSNSKYKNTNWFPWIIIGALLGYIVNETIKKNKPKD